MDNGDDDDDAVVVIYSCELTKYDTIFYIKKTQDVINMLLYL